MDNECNDTSWVNINVEGYDIYNVFTPNGDGINDTYQFADEMLTKLNVSIYNRWGQQVFEINDIKGVWDGRGYNGELLPDGILFCNGGSWRTRNFACRRRNNNFNNKVTDYMRRIILLCLILRHLVM